MKADRGPARAILPRASAGTRDEPASHPVAGAMIAFAAFIVLGWLCAAAVP
jgi:hypothetical protein